MAQVDPPRILPSLPSPVAWIVLAVIAIGVAVALLVSRGPEHSPRVTLTAGYPITTRARLAAMLAMELRQRGLVVDELASENTLDELAQVNSREVDFALVSGAMTSAAHPHVREVTALFPEALHLLVRREFAAGIGPNLAGLRGLRVDYGPLGSATAGLAHAVLEFAGVQCAPRPQPGACTGSYVELDDVDRMLDSGDHAALPDAMFHLATLPSVHATKLVQQADYELVEIPFAPAFRLGSLIESFDLLHERGEISRRFTQRIEIPPFSYRTDPPVPARAISTIGVRLLLVTNASVPADTVEKVLEAVFESRFAHIPQPALDRSLLELQPRHPIHEGTVSYLRRHRPWISGEDMDGLASGISVVGALLGAVLFLWRAWRERRDARREALVAAYQLRIAALESRVVELELGAELALEPLIGLQRDLLELKSEVLGLYTAGALGMHSALAELLEPLNAARDNVASMLLHVRENLEQRAESEGRRTRDLWTEAAQPHA